MSGPQQIGVAIENTQAWSSGLPTEDDLALDFSAEHADQLRYVALWNRWLQWNGGCWMRDDTLSVYDSIRAMIRYAATGLPQKERAKLLKAQTVSAVHKLVQADRRHAATIHQWDPDDWVLNTPGGIANLRTGTVAAHDPIAYCTKVTGTAPAKAASCPKWRQFLADVTQGDVELIAYLQRLAGYAATGSTQEHMLAFLWGTGRNGKGVFLNTLTAVLGDYAKTAPMDVFTETAFSQHPTELADLHGARLVVAQETDEGRSWNEARIKALTGGDPIKARFMRQDFFEFRPKFTLLIAGNHKPLLRNIDEALSSRLQLVPFTYTVPRDKRDPGLAEKLRAEYPGILRWVIDGAVEYRRIGLLPPAAVTAATAEYLDAEDVFSQWLADACECGPDYWETPSALFASWKAYAGAANEKIGSQKAFGKKLRAAGFEPSKSHDGRSWSGLKVRQAAVSPDPRYVGEWT